jgi:hypothetical protein
MGVTTIAPPTMTGTQPDDSTAVAARAAVVSPTRNQVDTAVRFRDDPSISFLLDK